MSAYIVLKKLQQRQYNHDQKAHQDVLHLPLAERMTHFALHLAKYSSRLAEKDTAATNLKWAAVDAFIVCLAASNALRVQISNYFEDSLAIEHQESISSLGLAMRRKEDATEDISDWCFRQFALGAGELATACEYLHHIEAAPYRKLMVDSLARVCRASIVVSAVLSVDLETAVVTRWEEVEGRQTC